MSRRSLGLAGLFAAALLFSALTMLNGIQPNDEGLMLQAASRIAGGQTPYSDFWWFYPPGQPYLLALLHSIFGPSLLTWRLVRVVANAVVVVLAYVLARRAAPRGPALAAAAVAAGAMAFPSGPHPFPIALACALGALLLIERPALAGVLIGVCGVWRIEFAAYAGLAVLAAFALRPAGRRDRLRAGGAFLGCALAVALVLYAPVVLSAGLGDSWRLLVDYPLTDFTDYQSLPFPLHYDGPLNTSGVGGFFADSSEALLHFYLPLVLVIGLVGSGVALAARWTRERWWQAAALVLGAGMAHYMLVRPDIFHTAPLAVMVGVLGAWAVAGRRKTEDRRRDLLRVVGGLAAVLAVVYALAEGADRFVHGIVDDTVALDLPAADGVRVAPSQAGPLEQTVRYVDAHVPPGRPIYVGTRRADLVTSGHPLLYVLADRPNVSRYDIAAPGVVTSAPVQREIVGDLQSAGRPLVVRWIDPLTAAPEPNRAGRSSGVRILDDYLAAEYRQTRRFGDFVVLERKP